MPTVSAPPFAPKHDLSRKIGSTIRTTPPVVHKRNGILDRRTETNPSHTSKRDQIASDKKKAIETVRLMETIDRKDQSDKFSAFLANVLRSPAAERYYNINGVGGVGKSTLIGEIFPKKVEATKWTYIYVPLEGESRAPVLSFAAFRDVLVETLRTHGLDVTDTAPSALCALLDSQPKRVILAIDGLSHITAWFRDVERFMLAKLKKTVVVIGSRVAVRLDKFDVRLNTIDMVLKPLTESEIAKDLDALLQRRFPIATDSDRAQITRAMTTVAYGNPAVLNEALRLVAQHYDADGDFRVVADPKLATLKTAVADFVVRTYVTVPEELSDQQPMVQAAVRMLAIYRRYDVAMLQALVKHMVGQDRNSLFADLYDDTLAISGLSQTISTTQLVVWDARKRGFVIDEPYRRVLIAAREVEGDGTAFRAAHAFAKEIYTQKLESEIGETDTRAIYVCELLYHIANADPPNARRELGCVIAYLNGEAVEPPVISWSRLETDTWRDNFGSSKTTTDPELYDILKRYSLLGDMKKTRLSSAAH